MQENLGNARNSKKIGKMIVTRENGRKSIKFYKFLENARKSIKSWII